MLGPFRVFADGVPVDERQWTRPKPKLIVKLLALQPHHQLHREQLMEMLWPELAPEAAARNLTKNIHLARRALEPDLKSGAASHFIVTRAQQVILRAPGKLWIDVDEFERQAADALNSMDSSRIEVALTLYEGDLLIEDPYVDWSSVRREQLRALHHDLLSAAALLSEASGDYHKSIERAKALLACDPSNEEAHRMLMRLYAVTGNRHQALRQYQQCTEILAKEIEAEADRATVELYENVLTGRLDLLAPPKSQQRAELGGAIDSLAVLPLVNASGDANLEYLSDGITENIINALSQVRSLRVMSRSTARRYKGREADARVVGRDLGVRAVLMGRLNQVGDSLVIGTELVDTSDGSQLWGERYTRKLESIFQLEEEISREISEKLRLGLTGAEQKQLSKRHTEDPEAYHLYLKGRVFWNKRSEERIRKGTTCFEEAIGLDPEYALAFTGLADCYTLLGDVGVMAISSKEAFATANRAASRALELDCTLAEAHTTMAHLKMHGCEWEEARMEFERALELNPNYALAHHWYSYFLTMTGRGAEGMAAIKRALDLDPLSLAITSSLAELLYFDRQYDAAVAQYRKTLEMDHQFLRVRVELGLVYEQMGKFDEAIRELTQASAASGENTPVLAALGHCYAMQGNREEALAVLDQLNKVSGKRYVSPYDRATIYAALGETDQAFDWLDTAYETQAEWIIYLTLDPRLAPLHTDSRLSDLAPRLGLKP